MKKVLVALLLVSNSQWSVLGSFPGVPEVSTEGSVEDLHRKWKELDIRVQGAVDGLLKRALPGLLRSSSQVDMSDQCRDGMLKVIFGVQRSQVWAYKMLDAIGKPEGGQLSGTVSMFGDYDECLDVVIPSTDPVLTGRYCLLDVRPPLPPRPDIVHARVPAPELAKLNFTSAIVDFLRNNTWAFYTAAFRIGICIPSSCTEDDVTNLASHVLSPYHLNTAVANCDVKTEKQLDDVQIAIVAVIASFVILVLLASFFESVVQSSLETKSNSRQLLESVSLHKNAEKIFDLNEDKDSTLSCLHGVRFFSMTWVVLGHAYLFYDYQMFRGGFRIWSHVAPAYGYQIIANTFLGVDSFLFMSALLLAHSCVQKFDQNGLHTFKPIIFIIRRIWRLQPAVMLAVGVALVMPLVGEGPMWYDTVGFMAHNCRKNWWQVLTLVNNFVPLKDQCLTHTWYISVDVQCFTVSMIYFAVLFRSKFWGNFFNGCLLFLSVLSTSLIAYFKGYPPTILSTVADKKIINEMASYTYFYPHPHFGVYAIGLGVGTLLARRKKICIPKLVQAFGWLLAVCCSIFVLFGTVGWNGGQPYGTLDSAAYAGLSKVGWVTGLAWLTFMCATGRGGIINNILSWKGYKPFNRISYLIYLFHLHIYLYFTGSFRGLVDATHFPMIWSFMGTFMTTLPVAVVLRLVFEAPVSGLESWFWNLLQDGARRRKNGTRAVAQNGRNEKAPKEISNNGQFFAL